MRGLPIDVLVTALPESAGLSSSLKCGTFRGNEYTGEILRWWRKGHARRDIAKEAGVTVQFVIDTIRDYFGDDLEYYAPEYVKGRRGYAPRPNRRKH